MAAAVALLAISVVIVPTGVAVEYHVFIYGFFIGRFLICRWFFATRVQTYPPDDAPTNTATHLPAAHLPAC